MKTYLLTALAAALAFASPAGAQTAAPAQDHTHHQGHGQAAANHAQHGGNHAQHGQSGDHRQHANCCDGADGRMACCEEGSQRPCCAKHQQPATAPQPRSR